MESRFSSSVWVASAGGESRLLSGYEKQKKLGMGVNLGVLSGMKQQTENK